MDLSGKVRLGRLFERVSASGRTYYTGRLGTARVMMFKNDSGEEGEWELFVQDGGDRAPAPPSATSTSRAQPSTPSTPRMPLATVPSSAAGGRKRTRPKGAEPAPIVDDDLSDLLTG